MSFYPTHFFLQKASCRFGYQKDKPRTKKLYYISQFPVASRTRRPYYLCAEKALNFFVWFETPSCRHCYKYFTAVFSLQNHVSGSVLKPSDHKCEWSRDLISIVITMSLSSLLEKLLISQCISIWIILLQILVHLSFKLYAE